MVEARRWLFTGLLAIVVGERLFEMRVAKHNTRWLREHGAVEVGSGHYPVMVVIHALFLGSCLFEVWVLDRPFIPALATVMVLLLAGTMAVRYWVISTLGRRWTTRILCLPGEPTIATGPYRLVRHPNYLAVMVEIVALPLLHTAWSSALIFSVANGFLLRHRIRVEDRALQEHSRVRP